MAKIKLVEAQLDDILVKDLKRSYKMVQDVSGESEKELLDAIATVLKYYMVEVEALEWLAKRNNKFNRRR